MPRYNPGVNEICENCGNLAIPSTTFCLKCIPTFKPEHAIHVDEDTDAHDFMVGCIFILGVVACAFFFLLGWTARGLTV